MSGDLVQAMTVSWRKMCEDVGDYCHQKKQLRGTWCLPQRIQLSVKEWTFPLCAYQFPDETYEVNFVEIGFLKVFCCFEFNIGCVQTCL